MSAGTVEGELMRGYLKSFVRQFDGSYLFLVIDQNIINAIAVFANEMLMPFHQRIEMLRTATHEYLQFLLGNEFLQIPINRSEADGRQLLAHPLVNLNRGRMRLVVLDGVPNDVELLGLSYLFSRRRHF